MADAPQTRRNRLLVPLTVVSLVCLAEAWVIAFRLGRAPAPAPVGYAPPPPNWQNPASVAPAPAAAVPFAFGKVEADT